MAFVGTLALVAFLVLRPMEISPAIGRLWPLETLTVIASLGLVREAFFGNRRAWFSPQIPFLLAFVAWSFAVTAKQLGAGPAFAITWKALGLTSIFMLLVALSLATIDKLRALSAVLTVCMALIAAIAVHQGTLPPQCIEVREGEDDRTADEWIPDGRECEGIRMCENVETGGKDGIDYLCERAGLFGSFSTSHRVGWRGQLGDPNELSVFISAMFPLLLALDESRSRAARLTTGAILLVGLTAMVMSQSRGGQLVLATISVVFFVRRFGLRGVLVALAISVPMLLLSWRGGADADASSAERAMILQEGLTAARTHLLLGVGLGQFQQEISLPFTAHNSYLLVLTETGALGYLLWCGLMWTTLKIPLMIAMDPPAGLEPRTRRFAEALATSLAGVLVGIFFLSFSYKQLLFVFLGLAGGLHLAVRSEFPSFRIRFSWRDFGGIAAFAVVMICATWGVSRTGSH